MDTKQKPLFEKCSFEHRDINSVSQFNSQENDELLTCNEAIDDKDLIKPEDV